VGAVAGGALAGVAVAGVAVAGGAGGEEGPQPRMIEIARAPVQTPNAYAPATDARKGHNQNIAP